MKTAGKNAIIPESQLSKQIATNDDIAANEEEVEEQIEELSVERAAGENSEKSDTDDVATPYERAVEGQAEEGRIDKVAIEDGINPSAAEEYIHQGHTHD